MSAPLRLRTFTLMPAPRRMATKVRQRLLRRPAIGQPLHVVERDQVHVRLPAAQQPRQLAGVRRAVVEAAQQHVFVGHLPAGLGVEIVGRVEDGRRPVLSLVGTIRVRSSSLGACSDTAR